MEITAHEIQRGLQDVYCASVDADHPRISDVALLASGFEADIFAFTLQTGDVEEAHNLVLRLYAGDGASEKSAREFDAMRRLWQVGYPVPHVLLLQRDGASFGRPFVVMERIDGMSLESAYWSASKEGRGEWHTLHISLMVQLHALEGTAIVPGSPLATTHEPRRFLDDEVATLSDWLARLEGKEPRSLRDALKWLRDRRATVPCERLSVIHGDFHRNNVLLRTDGTPSVIDWSNVRLADYRVDLAWTRLIAALSEPDGGRAELPLYEQLAEKPVAQIEYFDVLACLRLLLSSLVSLHFGAARQGLRPEVEERMRREVHLLRDVAALLEQRTGLKMTDFEDALTALLQ